MQKLSEKRETVGKVAADLLKNPEEVTAIDQTSESLTDFEKNVILAVERGQKEYPAKDFFVVVIMRRYRLLENVVRNDYFYRLTCPSPDYDQVVYKYHSFSDSLEFLWVIPAKDACLYLKEHALEVPKEEKQLLQYVLDFSDGTLYTKAKALNGEVFTN